MARPPGPPDHNLSTEHQLPGDAGRPSERFDRDQPPPETVEAERDVPRQTSLTDSSHTGETP